MEQKSCRRGNNACVLYLGAGFPRETIPSLTLSVLPQCLVPIQRQVAIAAVSRGDWTGHHGTCRDTVLSFHMRLPALPPMPWGMLSPLKAASSWASIWNDDVGAHPTRNLLFCVTRLTTVAHWSGEHEQWPCAVLDGSRAKWRPRIKPGLPRRNPVGASLVLFGCRDRSAACHSSYIVFSWTGGFMRSLTPSWNAFGGFPDCRKRARWQIRSVGIRSTLYPADELTAEKLCECCGSRYRKGLVCRFVTLALY